jgi:hypothetical protein
MRNKYGAALFVQMFSILLLCTSSVAQTGVILPKVAAAKNRGCKVFSTWKPAKKFLKHNPTFLQDGSYSMSVQYINRRKYNYRAFHVNFPRHTQFTSAEYSAVQVLLSKKIMIDGTVHIQLFGMNDSDAMYPVMGSGNAMVGTTGYDFSVSFPELKKGYDKLNEHYKQEAQAVADKKISCPVDITDLGYTLTDTTYASLHDLFFQFEYVEAQAVNNHFLTCYLASYPPFISGFLPWTYPLLFIRKKSSDAYPSNILMKLHVRNGAGEDIKTYGQVVFVREKHHSSQPLANAPWNTAQLIFKQALPVAMENLLSRFAEDTAVTNGIKERNRRMDELVRQYPELAKYLAKQRELATIADTKLLLKQSINEINKQMILLGGVMGENNAANRTVNPSGSAAADMGTAAAGAIGSVIINNMLRKKINQLKDKQYDMREQYARLESKEEKITGAQTTTMQNKNLADAWHSIGAAH